MAGKSDLKQNVTISLGRDTLRKVKIFAARRGTSISRFLAEQLDAPVGAEHAWERSERSALAVLEHGFHMGGVNSAGRAELHER